MSKILIGFVTLVCAPLYAGTLMCAAKDAIVVQGISCCLTRVSKEKCEELVDKLDRAVLERVASVQKDIAAGKYAYGQVPNCFWSAVSYRAKDVAAKAEPMNFPEFEKILDENYIEIREPRAGDLVVIKATVTEHVWKDEQEPRFPYTHTNAIHGAVSLGDGYVFQKENIKSETFSIDTIEGIESVYTKGGSGLGKVVHSRPHTHYYRLNQ